MMSATDMPRYHGRRSSCSAGGSVMPHVNHGRSASFGALLAVMLASAAAQSPARAPFDLEEATIADLQQRMQAGPDTSRSLVEKYLARIDAVDPGGPALHSVIETNP